jgi:hypothetical protein
MDEKIEVVFEADMSDNDEKASYASTIRNLTRIPEVEFTPGGGLFGVADTIKGFIGIPHVDKAIDKTAEVLGKWVETKKETTKSKKLRIKIGEDVLDIKGIDFKKGETEAVIKAFLMSRKNK